MVTNALPNDIDAEHHTNMPCWGCKHAGYFTEHVLRGLKEHHFCKRRATGGA